MGSELDITLRGPHAGMDAADTLKAMDALLQLLKELERTELERSPVPHQPHGKWQRAGHTRWTFTQLTLGSTRASLAPLLVPEESSYEQVDRVLHQTVSGFAAAETSPEIPPDWTANAAKLGMAVAGTLGASRDVGMRLVLRADGANLLEAEVTERARRNLKDAVKARYTSLGSRRGHLGGLSDAKGKLRAVLWSEIGHERIPLICDGEQRELLRQAWGHDRVEVTGRITENAQGQVVSIRVDEIELLPTEPSLSPEDLRGGFWPDMTGGIGALEHLAVIRGEA
ncbi:OB-fold nucleic acid binding domain-containing protein [Streptomyces sp. NPDC048385]|uniref:OB-fold nucleic acid binding domain-containing protein n=1 Tax=unclassified Streptomyces TaxID=2593676 RepID=UPI003448D982